MKLIEVDQVPDLIYNYRVKYQLSQSEFAKLLGVSRISIHNYESGRTVPQGKIYFALADLLGKEVSKIDKGKHKVFKQLEGLSPEKLEALYKIIEIMKEVE